MRRIVIAIASTITGLVLLFSWPTSTNRSVAAAPGTGDTTGAGSDTGTGTTSDTGSGATADAGAGSGTTADAGSGSAATTDPGTGTTDAGSGTASATPATQTFTGASSMTRYGAVTVQITVTDGVLTDAQAIEFPNRDRRDQQINNYAVPILNEEAVAAGSAAIQTVSGATFTSEGYIASLQDALDQAGL